MKVHQQTPHVVLSGLPGACLLQQNRHQQRLTWQMPMAGQPSPEVPPPLLCWRAQMHWQVSLRLLYLVPWVAGLNAGMHSLQWLTLCSLQHHLQQTASVQLQGLLAVPGV
jgi:hypothetical protein